MKLMMKHYKILNSLMIPNLDDGSANEIEIDKFESCEIDLNKFKETLFPKVEEEKQKIENQFRKAILYAI